MPSTDPVMFTVQEVAAYLRLKERKIYDLITKKRIPCTRISGKWLFPKAQIDQWLLQAGELTSCATEAPAPAAVLVGSHDPLLEWALRESGSAFSLRITGSTAGLNDFADHEAGVCGLHLIDPASGEYNLPFVRALPARHDDLLLLGWAQRRQGLLVAPGNPLNIADLMDVARTGARFASRQPGSGGHALYEHLLADANLAHDAVRYAGTPLRSESDVGLEILAERADVGLAVYAVARQLRLDFIPLQTECFDLLLRRRDYFEAPFQALLAYTRTPAFQAKAAEMGGYDLSCLGEVRYNAA